MRDKSKKILLVWIFNFLKKDRGNCLALYHPVRQLKDMGFSIDYFSPYDESFTDFDSLNDKEKLIDNLYLIKESFLERLLNKIWIKIHKHDTQTYVTYKRLAAFRKIIKNGYDFIYFHYIQNIDLIRYSRIPQSTKVIYHMQDSHFLHWFYTNGTARLGKVFIQELDALSLPQAVLCISCDEMLFWKRFYPDKQFIFFPYIPPVTFIETKREQDIDVLYAAHNNIYNIRGAMWFMDEVLPKLGGNASITFCGRFIADLPEKYRGIIHQYGITTIDFAPDLAELYERTKIVIVPIFEGAGMKTKTVEALAYNIPVVSTLGGVDGFPDKYESGCLVSDDPQIFSEYITHLLSDRVFYAEVKNKSKAYYDKWFSIERSRSILREVFKGEA